MWSTMPSSPAKALKRLTAGSSCSDRIAAPSDARLRSTMLVISGVCTYSAPARTASRTSLSTVSMFSFTSVEERSWTHAAVNVMCVPHPGQETVELAARLQFVKIVAAANMVGADEDLRIGKAAGALDHLFPLLRRAGGVDLVEGYAQFLKEGFRGRAITAELTGIDSDGRHCSAKSASSSNYIGKSNKSAKSLMGPRGRRSAHRRLPRRRAKAPALRPWRSLLTCRHHRPGGRLSRRSHGACGRARGTRRARYPGAVWRSGPPGGASP